MLSDLTIRGLQVTVTLPDAIHATQPALVTIVLANRKRRLASYSVALEALDRPLPGRGRTGRPALPLAVSPDPRRPAPRHRAEGPPGSRHSPAARLRAADPRRDRAGRRVGDHARRARTAAAAEAPGGHGLSLRALRQDRPAAPLRRGGPRVPGRPPGAAAGDPRGRERRGRGPPAGARARPLQPARVPGGRRAAPDPLAHHAPSRGASWCGSSRRRRPRTRGSCSPAPARRTAERLERALSEAASLAVHLLRGGTGWSWRAPPGAVPLDRGRGQERRILTALALYAPPGPGGRRRLRRGRRLREMRISLDSA